MKICTPAEMREIERRCGIPEETMMESAGAVASREIALRYWPELKRGRVAILVGPGHNGADGLVIARHLLAAGVSKVSVVLVEPLEKCKPLLQMQWKRLGDVERIDLSKAALKDFSKFTLIVDALYGIGLDRPLKGERIEHLIGAVNKSGRPIVSIDTPSGLDCQKGVAEGAAVRASMTLTFTLPKLGFFTAGGAELCGILRVLPIGFPNAAVASSARKHRLLTERLARKFLPARELSSNKTSFGHLGVCAGHPGFWGAGVLSAQAAFRVGTGYVTWASETAPVAELKFHPEVLTASLKDLFSTAKKPMAFLVGPGLGVENYTRETLEHVKETGKPAIIDADGITVLANEKWTGLPKNWILTPHSGELSRLLGISSDAIEADRFFAVQSAAKKLGCVVLLKGYRTLVAFKDKCVVVNSGNPALAKAGTGDVLAGFIGGFLAQGLYPWKAALLGAYVHGRLADEWVKSGKDVASLLASDLSQNLPEILASLRRGGSRLQGESL